MGLRRQSREMALKILFQVDLGRLAVEDVIRYFLADQKASPEVLEYTRNLARGVADEWRELDRKVAGCLQNWEPSRLAAVDRNILRLAAYELLRCPEIPREVVMDEAIEMAKKYSTPESGKFVNGVLDKLAAGLEN